MGTLTNGTVKLPSDINTLKAALYQHTCKILASSKYYPLSLLGGWGDAHVHVFVCRRLSEVTCLISSVPPEKA